MERRTGSGAVFFDVEASGGSGTMVLLVEPPVVPPVGPMVEPPVEHYWDRWWDHESHYLRLELFSHRVAALTSACSAKKAAGLQAARCYPLAGRR